MSAYLMGRVFYTDLPAHLKLTLLALADVADDDGTRVFLGQRRIARKVGVTERSIRNHLSDLREQGFIEKVGRVGARGQDRHRIVVEALPTHEQIALEFPLRAATGDRPEDVADRQPDVASTGSPVSPDRQPTSADSSVDSPVDSPKANAGTSGAVVVSDRWPYFLSKLQDQDDAWNKVTIGACVRIAQETDSEAVGTALSFAAMNAPIIEGSAYGWLRNAARGLKEARETG